MPQAHWPLSEGHTSARIVEWSHQYRTEKRWRSSKIPVRQSTTYPFSLGQQGPLIRSAIQRIAPSITRTLSQTGWAKDRRPAKEPFPYLLTKEVAVAMAAMAVAPQEETAEWTVQAATGGTSRRCAVAALVVVPSPSAGNDWSRWLMRWVALKPIASLTLPTPPAATSGAYLGLEIRAVRHQRQQRRVGHHPRPHMHPDPPAAWHCHGEVRHSVHTGGFLNVWQDPLVPIAPCPVSVRGRPNILRA